MFSIGTCMDCGAETNLAIKCCETLPKNGWVIWKERTQYEINSWEEIREEETRSES
jgi:hypothetical protein